MTGAPNDREQVSAKEWWTARARAANPMDTGTERELRVAVKEAYDDRGWRCPPDSRIVVVPSPFAAMVVAGISSLYWFSKMTVRTIPVRVDDPSLLAELIRLTSHDLIFEGQFSTYKPVSAACTKLRDMICCPTEVAVDLLGDLLEVEGKTLDVLSSRLLGELARTSVVAAVRACAGDDVSDFSARDLVSALGLQDAVEIVGRVFDAFELGNLQIGVLAFWQHLRSRGARFVGLSRDLEVMSRISSRSGPYLLHPEFCVLSDLPELLELDPSGGMHAEDGPACRWRDGTRIYSLRGVQVGSKFVVDPGTATAVHLETMRTGQREVCFDRVPAREQVLYTIRNTSDEEDP